MQGAPAATSLQALTCPNCGHLGDWVQRKAPQRRLEAHTGAAHCRRCGGAVFLKWVDHGTPEQSAREAARLFGIAAQVFDAFRSEPLLGAPRPVLREGNLMVSTWERGRSPERRMTSAAPEDSTALAHLMGQWLARLHVCFGSRPAAGPGSLSRRVDDAAQWWAAAGANRPAIVERGLAWLRRQAAAADSTAAGDEVLQHGDAKPGNFLLDGRRLIGFDVNGKDWGPAENDLAQMEAQTMLCCVGPFGRFDVQRAKALSLALRAGYAQVRPLSEQQMLIYRWLYGLRYWSDRHHGGWITRLRWGAAFQQIMDAAAADLATRYGA